MPVPEHVDPTGLRIELSHAAIDGNPETPLAVLIEAADAIPVGRSFQVGDIHAHRFVPTVMAQSAGLHTVQAVIKRSHPDAVPAVHEQADDQFIPEFLPILANRVGGRVILLQAMDGSHQDTPVRSLCQAFHAFVRHPAGGEGGIVHRPELVDARIQWTVVHLETLAHRILLALVRALLTCLVCRECIVERHDDVTTYERFHAAVNRATLPRGIPRAFYLD